MKSCCKSCGSFFFIISSSPKHQTPVFYFKQFSIEDKDATMKVCTDAVLLGTLTTTDLEPRRILDIGTGCGILALMMAQRFENAIIDAIDIDSQTVAVANKNFDNSPWKARLKATNSTLQDYSSPILYDLIVCNPPYFNRSLKNNEQRKSLARHDDSLPAESLLFHASKLLADGGQLSLITREECVPIFLSNARANDITLKSITHIHTQHGAEPKLCVLQFYKGIHGIEPQNKEMSIRNPDGSYSTEYVTLTTPFLLWRQQD